MAMTLDEAIAFRGKLEGLTEEVAAVALVQLEAGNLYEPEYMTAQEIGEQAVAPSNLPYDEPTIAVEFEAGETPEEATITFTDPDDSEILGLYLEYSATETGTYTRHTEELDADDIAAETFTADVSGIDTPLTNAAWWRAGVISSKGYAEATAGGKLASGASTYHPAGDGVEATQAS